MDMRISTIVLVALAIGLCEAGENLFGIPLSKDIAITKLYRRLNPPFNPDPKEVFQLLASAEDKSMELVSHVEIGQLIEIASRSDRIRIGFHCHHMLFDDIERIRKKLVRNKPLSDYCKYCHEQQYEYCFSLGGEVIFDNVVKRMFYEKTLRRFMTTLDVYIRREGEESYPVERTVRDFVSSRLGRAEKRSLRSACGELEQDLERTLLFLNKGGKEDSDYMRAVTDQQRQWWERCKSVSKVLTSKDDSE